MIVNKTAKIVVAAIALSMAAMTHAEGSIVQTVSAVADGETYLQALNPYKQNIPAEAKEQRDKDFINKINNFKQQVNVEIKQTQDENNRDVYLYFYVINKKNASEFSIDVDCLDLPSKQAGVFNINPDPIQKTVPGVINNLKQVSWWLNPEAEGAQAMWFYATTPPVKRQYWIMAEDISKRQIINKGGFSTFTSGVLNRGKIGSIEGPACPQVN